MRADGDSFITEMANLLRAGRGRRGSGRKALGADKAESAHPVLFPGVDIGGSAFRRLRLWFATAAQGADFAHLAAVDAVNDRQKRPSWRRRRAAHFGRWRVARPEGGSVGTRLQEKTDDVAPRRPRPIEESWRRRVISATIRYAMGTAARSWATALQPASPTRPWNGRSPLPGHRMERVSGPFRSAEAADGAARGCRRPEIWNAGARAGLTYRGRPAASRAHVLGQGSCARSRATTGKVGVQLVPSSIDKAGGPARGRAPADELRGQVRGDYFVTCPCRTRVGASGSGKASCRLRRPRNPIVERFLPAPAW